MGKIEVAPGLEIDEKELVWDFVRAAGPGGQNVNKVATAVQLRFDVAGSLSLEPEVKARLARRAGRNMTREGVLIIVARRYRSQLQNRQEALRRLSALIVKTASPPKPRLPTRPGMASRAARVDAKKKRGQLKKGRGNRYTDE